MLLPLSGKTKKFVSFLSTQCEVHGNDSITKTRDGTIIIQLFLLFNSTTSTQESLTVATKWGNIMNHLGKRRNGGDTLCGSVYMFALSKHIS